MAEEEKDVRDNSTLRPTKAEVRTWLLRLIDILARKIGEKLAREQLEAERRL